MPTWPEPPRLRSTLIASKLPVQHWPNHVGEPTLADAILDCLLHNVHWQPLKAAPMRKTQNPALDPS